MGLLTLASRQIRRSRRAYKVSEQSLLCFHPLGLPLTCQQVRIRGAFLRSATICRDLRTESLIDPVDISEVHANIQ